MQKNRAFILVACLALLTAFLSRSVTTAMPPDQASAATFKTPEDAITTYLTGVAQNDFNKILEACAINEMSENFKFDLYIDRVRAFTLQAPAPANQPFFVEVNKAQLTSQVASQVKILVYSLLSTENVSDGKVVRMDIDGAKAFIKEVDPSRLAGLEVKKIGLPNKTIMSTTRYQENAAKQARVYGADELTERVALFSFEQNYYYIGFSLLRYGDNWKLYSQNSPMANLSPLGGAEKTTPEAFDSMISGS